MNSPRNKSLSGVASAQSLSADELQARLDAWGLVQDGARGAIAIARLALAALSQSEQRVKELDADNDRLVDKINDTIGPARVAGKKIAALEAALGTVTYDWSEAGPPKVTSTRIAALEAERDELQAQVNGMAENLSAATAERNRALEALKELTPKAERWLAAQLIVNSGRAKRMSGFDLLKEAYERQIALAAHKRNER